MHTIKSICLFVLAISFNGLVQAAPSVLASIKPLQLITQAVLGETGESQVLLPPGATPHHFTLRPSDMKKLGQANLVIWLGAKSERYLAKPIAKMEAGAEVLDLQPYLTANDEGYLDPHLWLSSEQAVRVAKAITEKVVALDAGSESQYRANLASFTAELSRIKTDATNALKGSKSHYLVYHDAYGYFEREYGLSHAGVVSLHEHGNPGAKHLLALQNTIAQQGVSCILTEPESNAAVVSILTADTNIRTILLDPMAGDLKPNQSSYARFLQHVVETFKQCRG